MWEDILKKPFHILDGTKLDTYDEVFQGVQIRGETRHWTFDFDEAVEYAFFGSEQESTPRDDGKPKVFRAIPSKKFYYLLADKEYGEGGMGRGIEPTFELGEDYFKDATKKKVPDEKVIESMRKTIEGDRLHGTTSATRDNAKEHFEEMLKYF
jgi:hypothetical protein